MAVLGTPEADLYDWPEADESEGEGLVASARPGYRQVADTLRARISEGHYPPRSALPGQSIIANELGADIAVVNRAVDMLEAEGLVRRAGQGRRTMIEERRRFRAEVAFPEGGDAPAVLLAPAVRKAAEDDPAVSGVKTHIDGDGAVTVSALVVAAHGGLAGNRLAELVRSAALDGWDVAAASVSARPA